MTLYFCSSNCSRLVSVIYESPFFIKSFKMSFTVIQVCLINYPNIILSGNLDELHQWCAQDACGSWATLWKLLSYNLPEVRAGVGHDLLQVWEMLDAWWTHYSNLIFMSRNCQYCAPNDFLKLSFLCLGCSCTYCLSDFPTENSHVSNWANEQDTKDD